MSSKIKGLRRVGIVGLSTVVAASMMTLSAVTATALPPAYTALTAPNVGRATAQAAGNVTLDFTNSFTTNAAQTFTVAGNNCATAPGIAAATEFAAWTGALSGPFLAGTTTTGTATAPSMTGVLGSSSTQCATAGIQDQITLTLTSPSSVAGPTDWFKFTLSGITYNVGASAPLGNISVATSGALRANASVVNAVVAGTTHTSPARVLAVPSASGVNLGTQTLVENSPGAFFGAGGTTTTVLLTLGGTSTFTAAVTPTVTLPAGYTSVVTPTTAAGTYSFTVTSPATPVAATMTVSGLTILASATATDVTLAITGGVTNPAALKAVRVVNYTARTGGATRYETAAALFSSAFGTEATVVLSGGALFPDALSANYLAGKLGTGTLLTTPSALSNAARTAIINAGVSTVYITGGTGAVSQGVQNTIEAMHVGNNPTAAFINTVRLGGIDRYATNRIVNAFNFTPETTVILAGGLLFPDALSVGPVAYAKTFPLIITRGTTLGASENTQLNDFNPTNVIIVGGTGVVSQAIQNSLVAQGMTVTRLGGTDRTLTAAAVLSWATLPAQGFYSNTTYIASGDNFPDALAAGPVAGSTNRMIMISRSSTVLGAGIPLYFGTKTLGSTSTSMTTIGTLHALGLTGATSNALMRAAALAIGE